MTDIDLQFLARQNERMLAEMTSFRDDMRVLSAMTIRVDHTLSLLLDEVRAIHSQIGHIGDRVRRLEDAK